MRIAFIAVAVLCLIALFRLPYGYYTFLRIVTCLAGAAGAYFAYEREDTRLWAFPLAAIAILFNPIVPVHLTREIWQPINVVVAGFFGAAAAWLAPKIEG